MKEKLLVIAIILLSACSTRFYLTDNINLVQLEPIAVFGEDLKLPDAINTDANSNIYVGDIGRILVFTPDFNFLKSIGQKGSGQLEFYDEVKGIAIDSKGRIIAVDEYNYRVQILSKDGVFLKEFGKRGWQDGSFIDPQGVCVDDEDNIYVTDAHKMNVQKFSSDGEFILSFGGKPYRYEYTEMHKVDSKVMGKAFSKFDGIECIAYDDGKIFVSEENNGMIKVYDKSGNFLYSFGGQGIGKGKFHDQTEGLAFDNDGLLYVVDEGKSSTGAVQVYEASGKQLLVFESTHPFASPDGIAIDKKRDLLFITDQNNFRIQVFDLKQIKSKIKKTICYGKDDLFRH